MIIESILDNMDREMEKIALFSRIPYMTRPELKRHKTKLQNDYFNVGMKDALKGGALSGSVGGGAAYALKRFTKNPIAGKAVIPVAAAATMVGLAAAPTFKKKKIMKDLLAVERSLRTTNYTNLKKMNI